MNLKSFHTEEKSLSTKKIFSGGEGSVVSIQLKAGGLLKEHITTIPALLICVNGKALFKNEKGKEIHLSSGDVVNIEANVKHWLEGVEDAQLVLVK